MTTQNQSTPSHPTSSKSLIRDMLLVAQLILVCTILRLLVADIPNVAPVAALALFAGLWVHRKWLAWLAPVATLAISDRLLNESSYELPLMLIVYASLAAPIFFAPFLIKMEQKWRLAKADPSTDRSASLIVKRAVSLLTGSVGCVLAGSLLFFVASNLGVWWYWYERDLNGLGQCFTAAIPFFRFTLLGDLSFAAVFGSVHLAASLIADSSRVTSRLGHSSTH